MDNYIDLSVLPDPEFKCEVLMNALFAKLHRAISQRVPRRIGISFPDHHKTLGEKLRLHSDGGNLSHLMADDWLKGLRDYTHTTSIRQVPAKVKFRTVGRIQIKSAHNKRKRSVAKGWLSAEEAFEKIPDDTHRKLDFLPYAQITSLSNGNVLRIYIEHGELSDTPVLGDFSSYGLSKTATVPWF